MYTFIVQGANYHQLLRWSDVWKLWNRLFPLFEEWLCPLISITLWIQGGPRSTKSCKEEPLFCKFAGYLVGSECKNFQASFSTTMIVNRITYFHLAFCTFKEGLSTLQRNWISIFSSRLFSSCYLSCFSSLWLENIPSSLFLQFFSLIKFFFGQEKSLQADYRPSALIPLIITVRISHFERALTFQKEERADMALGKIPQIKLTSISAQGIKGPYMQSRLRYKEILTKRRKVPNVETPNCWCSLERRGFKIHDCLDYSKRTQ